MGADENMIPVPVQLSSFTAVQNGGNVVLTWITATEVNTSGFEVEKSSNNTVFNKIGFVKGNGSSTEITVYTYTDKNEAGNVYYRLKMIDLDGSFEYSPSVEFSSVNVNSFTLEQNYPNPFNPSTVISYTVPVDGFVKLAVYNSLGEEVALLVNANLNAGSYNVEFNGNNLTSGIYFYKLQAGEFTSVKKMMMIK
jgi:hypothetical protein